MTARYAFSQLLSVLYAFALRTIGIAERRCSYCNKLMGYKYGPAFRRYRKDPLLKHLPFLQTHGICEPCVAKHFPEPVAIQQRRSPRQRTSRKNLRRRTGGWSGAVAVR